MFYHFSWLNYRKALESESPLFILVQYYAINNNIIIIIHYYYVGYYVLLYLDVALRNQYESECDTNGNSELTLHFTYITAVM